MILNLKFFRTLLVLLFLTLGNTVYGQVNAQQDISQKVIPEITKSNSSVKAINLKREAQLQKFLSLDRNRLRIAEFLGNPTPLPWPEVPPEEQPEPANDRYSNFDLKDVMTVWCDANWTQTCEGVETWKAPTGFDVCKFTVTEESKAHGEWSSGADLREIRIKVKSFGSFAFFDQWGGWVRVRISSVTLVSSNSSTEYRKNTGCNLGGVIGSPRTESFCLPTPTNPGFGSLMCRDYAYQNGIKKYLNSPYVCGVCATAHN